MSARRTPRGRGARRVRASHPSTAILADEPRPTRARWRPPARCGATIEDLGPVRRLLGQKGHPEVLGRSRSSTARTVPAVQHRPRTALSPCHGLGFQGLRRRLRHARRAHRLDARVPGNGGWVEPQASHRRRGARQRDRGLLAGRGNRECRAASTPSKRYASRRCPAAVEATPSSPACPSEPSRTSPRVGMGGATHAVRSSRLDKEQPSPWLGATGLCGAILRTGPPTVRDLRPSPGYHAGGGVDKDRPPRGRQHRAPLNVATKFI